MKFADLEFKPHPIAIETGDPTYGVQALVEFPNGYGASIIRTKHSYGGGGGLYELAVFRGNSIAYDTPVTSDVLGHLTESAVEDALDAIERLEPAQCPDT